MKTSTVILILGGGLVVVGLAYFLTRPRQTALPGSVGATQLPANNTGGQSDTAAIAGMVGALGTAAAGLIGAEIERANRETAAAGAE